MPLIPDELIDRVRESTDIVDVVSEYVQLKKAGRNFVGLCPFHNEDTPSFSVNPDLQIYKCFGCGVGGPVFKFIQEIDRVSFVEAVTFLAQRAGISLPKRPQDRAQADFHDQLYRANELASKYFHHLLCNEKRGLNALEYIRSRGVDTETIERFGVGYAPQQWDALLKVAAKRGLPSKVMETAGLATKGNRGHYDRFRDRLAFPITNLSGRVIAFGARTLKPDQTPKYLNSPESPIYHKSSVVYGLHKARETVRQTQSVLIVEGYMDVLTLVQHGIENVVASSGTALTDQQCKSISRYAERAVLLFDGDAAGSAAALRGVETILAAGMEAKAISLPDNHDPDSFLKEFGAEAVADAVEQAGSALDFYLDQISSKHDLTTATGKAGAAAIVKPLLLRTPDAMRRDLMLREMAQRLGIDEQAVRQELQNSLSGQVPRARSAGTPPQSSGAESPPSQEKQFLGLLLNYPDYIKSAAKDLSREAFVNPGTRAVLSMLLEQYSNGTQFDLAALMNDATNDSLVELISGCAMEGFDDSQIEQQFRDYVHYFNKEVLSRRITECQSELQAAVAEGDAGAAERIGETLVKLLAERQEAGS